MYDLLSTMSSPEWTPFCSKQRKPHPLESSFCPYCGATNPAFSTSLVDLTGSSPVFLSRTSTEHIAETAKEAANQRIRAKDAMDSKPHSGQAMTIGKRPVLSTPTRTTYKAQNLQAFYSISITLVEEPWEYLSMEDKDNGRVTIINRTIAGNFIYP